MITASFALKKRLITSLTLEVFPTDVFSELAYLIDLKTAYKISIVRKAQEKSTGVEEITLDLFSSKQITHLCRQLFVLHGLDAFGT
jgi:hypothetical protein